MEKQKQMKMQQSGRGRRIRDFVTVLALSFHAIFEGLAVGLESTVADVWTLFGGNTKFEQKWVAITASC